MKNIPTVVPKNPLEEALDKLDLQGTLVLLTILTQRALYLQQASLKTASNLLTPNVPALLKP